jgi:hypothetical protein
MTSLTDTIQNIHRYVDDACDLDGCQGVCYAVIDPGADVTYVLTDSGDLLVVDTDINRVRTGEQMHADGLNSNCVPEWIEQRLGVTINEDWSIA